MRSEKEMLDLVINTALKDDRIRAVILSGSRTNPDAPKDFFQDFDVVYVTTDIQPYIHNLEYIRQFGDLMILQLPDEMGSPEPEKHPGYCYLMQFIDGNRIDLTFILWKKIPEMVWEGFNVVLLDKDGYLSTLIPPGKKVSLPEKPTANEFADCCNEFLWVAPYVAKGLWRKEITYARTFLDEYLRRQLMMMLSWYVGVITDFKGDPGKSGKYLQHYLPADLWNLLLRSYSNADINNTWEALFSMTDLFRSIARHVADHFGFAYPVGDDERVTAHLNHVRNLPPDADEMYP